MKPRFISFCLLLCALLLTGGAQVKLPEVRAIWVTRFDYKTPADVEAIVANCAGLGLTDIFFQIRGNGTVFYPSRVEPWAFELTGNDASATGRNPGWNPLQTACNAAAQNGIRLHAYMNVLPGWRGRVTPPISAGQLWTAHPDWFMVDSIGAKMQATTSWYAFVNPAHPQVRAHLKAIAGELAHYNLAGLHLDYIRFPYDYKDVAQELYPRASAQELRAHSEFSYDPVSVAMAKRMAGPQVTRSKWDMFRRNAVSQTVLDVRTAFKETAGPQSVVSSSVLADLDDGYSKAFQDSRRWVKEHLVDWIVPMNYNARLFDERLHALRKKLGRRAVAEQLVNGIDCKADAQEIRRQVAATRESGCRGFALFAYSYFFENHRPTEKARAVFSTGF